MHIGGNKTSSVGSSFLTYQGGIQLQSNTGQSLPGDGTNNTGVVTGVVFDDLNIYNVASPNQFVVPAGITHVRMYAHAIVSLNNTLGALTASFDTHLFKNGANAVPGIGAGDTVIPGTLNGSVHAAVQSICSQILPSNAGDSWTISFQQFSGQTGFVGQFQFGAEFYK